jgi:DNA polymerase-3 subunit epsilon
MKKEFHARDFAAIDFETASLQRSSICSVGVVVVREREIVGRLYRLIRPRPNFYTDWATRVHGLSYRDTDLAPDFPRVWEDVRALARGLPFVAHNSTFDESCLQAVFAVYGLGYPGYDFYCTRHAAARAFPNMRDYRLGTIARYIGHDLQQHHDALADAEACARIAFHVFP